MKNHKSGKILMALFAIALLAFNLSAQNMTLDGRLRSSNGTRISGAKVSIFDAGNGTLLNTCYSNAQGVFISERVLRLNQRIRVEIAADGFELFTRQYTIRSGRTGWINLTTSTRPVIRAVSIKGTIKSDQVSLLKDVIVSFYYWNQEKAEDNDISDEKGQYNSEKRFKIGDKIVVVAKKTNYSEESKTIEIKDDRDVTVDFVLKTRTYIAGFVADARTGQFLQDAQISYQSKEGPFNSVIRTNQSGYFDFDVPAPFNPGDQITVRVEKEGYAPEEKRPTITTSENKLNFLITKWQDKGIDLGIRVFNKKNKPLRGVEISYFDIDTNTVLTPEDGAVLLNIKKAPGDLIHFDLLKSGYKLEPREHTLRKELQYIDIKMEKAGSKCPCWLYTGLGLAAVSGTGYLLYDSKYKKADNIKNPNWESDYKKSTTWLRVGTISGGLAIGALTGSLICLTKEARNYREAEAKRRRTGFAPLIQADDASQSLQLGIAYTF